MGCLTYGATVVSVFNYLYVEEPTTDSSMILFMILFVGCAENIQGHSCSILKH